MARKPWSCKSRLKSCLKNTHTMRQRGKCLGKFVKCKFRRKRNSS